MAEDGSKTEEERVDEKKYFQKVLDDIVSLNSLFTVAVFVGLSLATPGQIQSLEDRSECHSDTRLRKRLVSFEIASFSCFVFSGFMAKTVKIFLYIYQKQDLKNPHRQKISLIAFYLSIYGTMCGCLFLLLAMVDVVQIKLGRLSCGSKYSLNTVLILVGAIAPALLVYFTSVSYGLVFTTKKVMADSQK
ncbi:uncharacterized protein LOC116187990 [Punica granatum]|uniref:Uncharacterized protein LOC116187990 n=2 Tax=Punica granatum TaxID=22663 RepID=A0A6P8BRF6_PUNGR|nr:uncharacterized protein LOC116187990 [Punica granatum]PKI63975.1 hypothetical protein CRG98_015651 [Punica granatum]